MMNRFEFNSNLINFKNKQDELAHYGTRGQKWGVRKWQNYDGTFNEAGKIRYFGKGSSDKEKMGGLMSSMLNRAAKKADKMQEKYVNKWNNDEKYRNKMINKNVDIMKNHKSMYGMDGLTDDEVEKLTKAIMKKGVADIYEVRNEAAKYKADKKNYFNDIDLDDMQIHDYVKTSEVAKDHPMFNGKFGTVRNPKMNLKVDPELLKEYSEDEIEDSIQSVVNDIRSKAPEGPKYDPSSYDVTVDRDGTFHIDFHYDDTSKDNSKINWKQLDESNHDSYGKSEEQYWKDKEKAEKYLDENYDKDFAQVIKDDYDTGGVWGDVDAAYEQFKQNPYEYLKKYSRDPKYNLSPKEEKALQKEADKIDKAFAKGDIGTLNLLQSDKTEQIRKEANESFNKNCSEELGKLKDLYKDYDDNSEYYCALTALANSLAFGNTKVRDMANMIHGYVYDDFDQGTGSSGHVYMLDKGYTKDDMTNMCKTNYENNEKFKNDIDLSISKDPLIGKTNERVRTQLRNALHNGSRSNLINKDAYDYDIYSYRLQESGDTNADYSNKIKRNLPEAKKIINKVYKTCSNKEYGWWYLNQAINELGYSDVNYKDLTDSDWNKINAKIRELG